MQINLIKETLIHLQTLEGFTNDSKVLFESKYSRYTDDKELLELNVKSLSDDEIKVMITYLKGTKGVKGSWNATVILEDYLSIRNTPQGGTAKTIQGFHTIAENYIRSLQHKYIFRKEEDGSSCARLITWVKYHPKTKNRDGSINPDYVSISFSYIKNNENKDTSINIYVQSIKSKTVVEVLNNMGYYLANDEKMNEYQKQLDLFHFYKKQIGLQFLGNGYGFAHGGKQDSWGYWRSSYKAIKLDVDDKPIRMIVDDVNAEDEKKPESIKSTMVTQFSEELSTEEKTEEKQMSVFAIPYHPYLYMYDLTNHRVLDVHISFCKLYEYKPELINKLILPDEHKELIQILTEGTADIMEDIIEGKKGGIIIGATGVPGTGKTLTAEVYTEVIKRPLYIVQSSQLGVDVNQLEKTLKSVLRKAQRWNAILLIDEADVYIHERGDDLVQNAIVGVFLRVLETYSGVLFLTSNRATIIDDAILSRMTAHIRYSLPTREDAGKIWNILANNFKIEFAEGTIEEVINKYPNFSGRDIKNILKLSSLLMKRKNIDKLDLKMIEFAIKFQDVNTKVEVNI
jgi:hypothetical protein